VKRASPYGRWSARVYSLLIDPLLRELRSRITALAVGERLTDVVDIACATGAQCRSLHRAGIAVTGVDLSAAMIERAQRIGPSAIDYLVGSALALPFPEESFPGAILSLCLHEQPFPDQDTIVKETLRVVRPGGILILAEYSRSTRTNPPWALINIIERLAGSEHCHNFRRFMQAGGISRLDPLLSPVERRIPAFGKTIEILIAKRP